MAKGDWVRMHLVIKGRVQGVFFRASTQEQAHRLGIKGWVRNCPDGSVEVMAEGPRERAEEFLSWCRQGPPHAQVDEVKLRWEKFSGEFQDFRVKR